MSGPEDELAQRFRGVYQEVLRDRPRPAPRPRRELSEAQRASLRKYLDALDADDEVARAAKMPVTWDELREIIADSCKPRYRPVRDEIIYKTVQSTWGAPTSVAGGIFICRTHVLEMRVFTIGREPLKIRALGVRERLGVEELREMMHDESPMCVMCKTVIAHGNICYNDECKTPLHPQWPAVYCSNRCAMEDL